MNTKELIEKQIEEATEILNDIRNPSRAGRVMMRDESLNRFCERLLRVVQNQQAQIEAIEKRLKDESHTHLMGTL